jgi:hypothetical protein
MDVPSDDRARRVPKIDKDPSMAVEVVRYRIRLPSRRRARGAPTNDRNP